MSRNICIAGWSVGYCGRFRRKMEFLLCVLMAHLDIITMVMAMTNYFILLLNNNSDCFGNHYSSSFRKC